MHYILVFLHIYAFSKAYTTAGWEVVDCVERLKFQTPIADVENIILRNEMDRKI